MRKYLYTTHLLDLQLKEEQWHNITKEKKEDLSEK